MPTEAEIEAAARVLCGLAYFQLPVAERPCGADAWPDLEIAGTGGPIRRWQTFSHEARLALEAAERARAKAIAPAAATQLRAIIEQTRERSDDLVAAGVDRDRLEEKLTELETYLERFDHDPDQLHILLSELRSDLFEVESKMIGSGLLQTLHQILATGVPTPR